MSRLNKTQIYAIRWLNSQNKTAKQIADELELVESQVQKTLEKNTATSQDNNIKTAKSPSSKSHSLMITETASKKTKNVSIMTKEASELNDNIKQNMCHHPVTEKAIFRPKK